MEAHRDFGAFRGDCVASLLAWLRSMLRNNVATIHQRHLFAQRRGTSRERSMSLCRPASSSNPLGLEGLIPSETTSPSQRMMRDEAAARLAICLERLPETQAEAIRLRYLEGMSLKDIAQRMGKTEMAVAGLLKRGLCSLRLDLLTDH
ncbi:MAG: sigma-70 family RNA polymerase sigma factor [Pirellulales bacterium]